MPETLKKCVIARYDKTITKPPFLTIPIDTVEVLQPSEGTDEGGVIFAFRLMKACKDKGYWFRFYSMTHDKEGIDYEINVD